jgi:hypothetical protein
MKALYTLLILLIPFVGYGQESYDKSNLNSYLLSQQIDNQDRFTKQVLTGKTLGLIGMAGTIVGAVSSVPEISYVGSGLALFGFVIEIGSYKYLKKENLHKLEKLKFKAEILDSEIKDYNFLNNTKYSYFDYNGGVKECYFIENVGSGKVKVKNIDNDEVRIIDEKELFIIQD